MKTLSVVLPNYNGLGILQRCFPETHAQIRKACPQAEILLIDDASTDGGADWLESAFPDVRVVRQPVNQGFGATANRGVELSGGELTLLLNTDIVLLEGWLDAALPHFADERIFAVTFQSLDADLAFREGANRVAWRGGLPFTHHNPRDQRRDDTGRWSSSYPVGGHCLLRRARFIELGGFDPLFEPFYWEDADLGLRAGARGWPTVYEPASRVIHLEQGSIRTHHKLELIRRIKLRNRFLVAWNRLGRRGWLLRQGLFALPRFAAACVGLEPGLLRARREAAERWRALRGGDG